MSEYNDGGLIPGPHDFTIWSRGPCPLDGYLLIETEPTTVEIDGEIKEVEGGWEHVIPPSEIPTISEALRKIAEAHQFETTAEAEAITRRAASRDD